MARCLFRKEHIMIIYLLLFFIITFFILICNKENKKNKSILFFVFVIFTIISAFRASSVGTDTMMYLKYFNNVQSTAWSNYLYNRFEPLFFYLCKAIGLVSTKSNVFLIITSLLIIPFIGEFIKKYSDNYFLSCLVYLGLNIFFFNMTGIRQSIAISILLLSYTFMIRKENKKAIILIIVASFFHTSAMIFFIPLIIYNKLKVRENKMKILVPAIILMIVSYFFALAFYGIFSRIFNTYSNYAFSKAHGTSNYFGALLQAIFYIGIFIFELIVYGRNFNNIDKKFNANFYLVMSLISACIQIMSMKMTILSRGAIYFSIFSIVSIPLFVESIKNNKSKILCTFAIVLVLGLYCLTIAIYRPNWNSAIPYSFYK